MKFVPSGLVRSRSPKSVKLSTNEARIGSAMKMPNRITNGAAKAHPVRSSRQRRAAAVEPASAVVRRCASAGTVMSTAHPYALGLLLHLVGGRLWLEVAGRHLLEGLVERI